ncbi:MAG: hypothetical protein KDA44_22480 [Planctomycetales bacterium]|nr:hypothetical protein [Planctomycetales bacterium]
MGQTIIGGVIGALVGLAAYIGLEIGLESEYSWFAIVVGLLTGLGVRQLNTSAAMHHPSYLRGAISGLIALAAIAGAPSVKAMVMSRTVDKEPAKPTVKKQDAETDEEAADGAAAAADVEEPDVPERVAAAPMAGGNAAVPGGEFDVMQGVFMALGAFVAYEFARGSGGAPAPVAEGGPPAEPASDETEPAKEGE